MTERFIYEGTSQKAKKNKKENKKKNNGDPRTWTLSKYVTAFDLREQRLYHWAVSATRWKPLSLKAWKCLVCDRTDFTILYGVERVHQRISRWVDHYSTVLWEYCACVCGCIEKKSIIACNTVFGRLLGVFPDLATWYGLCKHHEQ